MIWLAVMFAGLSLSIAFWIGQELLVQAKDRYKSTLMHDAKTNLRDMFVFIDVTNLWPAVASLAMGVALFYWVLFDQILVAISLALIVLYSVLGSSLSFMIPFTFVRRTNFSALSAVASELATSSAFTL